MKLTACLVLLLVAVIASKSLAQSATSACVRYEPDTVALSGHLERHTFYGAPGYGEDPRHDEKETGFYLALTTPTCSTGGRDPDLNDPRAGVRRVQLVLDSAGYARLRPFLGKHVTVRGTLFASFNGHHHAPLLLS